jgi:REP element-mobilizing transposase RayT
VPGGIYHVTSRGNRRECIYLDDLDRRRFLRNLDDVVRRFEWLCHAYCLMGNHYHLVVETPKANISAGMQRLNGLYAESFNRRHRLSGHLFQGRFFSTLIELDTHLLELARYVVLNPVRAGLCPDAADWMWSSYRATAGLERRPRLLTQTRILAQFGRERDRARLAYAAFVREGLLVRSR